MTTEGRKRLEENCHVTHVGGNVYCCNICFALTNTPGLHHGWHAHG